MSCRSRLQTQLTCVGIGVTVAAFGASGCGGDEPETGPVPWQISPREQPHGAVVPIAVDDGYCDGGPKPTYQRTDVRETSGAVVITAFVTQEEEPGGDCAGLGIRFEKTIRLKAPIGD